MTTAPEETPEVPPDQMHRLVSAIVDAVNQAGSAKATNDASARHEVTAQALGGIAEALAPTVAKLTAHLGPTGELLGATDPPSPLGPINEAISGFFLNIGLLVGWIIAIVPALGRVAIQSDLNHAMAEHADIPLSPPDLADMVVRNLMDEGVAAQEAAMSGLNGTRFANMVLDTGEPPGPVDMLKLWLRGALSTPDLHQAIRYSRIRDEYINDVEQLAYTQMSPADALMCAIKEVPTAIPYKDLFIRGGGMDGDYEMLYEATGDSIGIQQSLLLWHFGLISEADVNKVLGRSRINPMFYPIAKLTHFHPLAPYQIEQALKGGTITAAEATQWLEQMGVPADQARALAMAHATAATGKAKTETEGLISAAYEDLILSRAQALQALEEVGYNPAAANMILDVADAKMDLKQQSHAVNAIRSDYVDRRITRAAASNALDTLGVRVEARNHWLADWDVEINTHPKVLTATQIADAAKKTIIEPADAMARLQQLGYDAGDSAIILELHGVKP